jgi:hypothetical protein
MRRSMMAVAHTATPAVSVALTSHPMTWSQVSYAQTKIRHGSSKLIEMRGRDYRCADRMNLPAC